ncbi:VOC family protein [Rubellimicrobium sp. CFH 75288]|uniref:VOC family protein n=1 Tax=Rubellimicrobium sp. CFH 75288 TaxID=2697034 RepID=UPI0014130A1F|nr:VOC family protein [Rubellimicrobium sp. CFH 75288]NAZ35818.1 glyoxalase/bleomycin resistance/extradiol dioxygenase family protein [Rubellimicrobium sp. CFH 75288]
MPSPAHVLETAIYVDDLDAAQAFYRDVIGLEEIRREGDRHVFFRCGPGVFLVFRPEVTERGPEPGALPIPPHGARGPGHTCFAAEPDGIEAWRDRLGRAGVAIEQEIAWPKGGRSLYFRDPAGNSLEIAEAVLWSPAKEE